jgi:hypothetical protein
MTSQPQWIVQTSGFPEDVLATTARGLGSPLVIDKDCGGAFYYHDTLNRFFPLGNERLTYIRYESDFSANTSSPLPSDLKFTPAPNRTYVIEGQIGLQTDSALKGPVLTLSLPSGLTSGLVSMKAATSSSASAEYHGGIGSNPAIAATGMPANTPLPATFTLSFTTGPAPSGDFAVSISSEV